MATRRALGSLESEILVVLWRSDRALTPAEVLEELDSGLAYTTVMTVLGRLWNKGLARREKAGRAYCYSAAVSEADLSANRMRTVLATSSDALATMSNFVDGLDAEQQRQLRALLEKRSR